jgi:PAS domain S-box-containing protein
MAKPEWISRLKQELSPPAAEEFFDLQQSWMVDVISLAILVAILISSLSEALAGNLANSGIPLLTGLALTGAAFWVNRQRQTSLASIILVASLLVVLTWLLFKGRGIHDIAITLYPVVMIVVSLLFRNRIAIAGYLLVIASIALVVFAEMAGWLRIEPENTAAHPTDFVILSLIMGITGIGLALINTSIQHSYEQARQSTKALQASEARFRSLAENAPDLILSIDRDSVIQYANRTGPNQQSFIGQRFHQYLQPGQSDQIQRMLDQIFSTGKPTEIEARLTEEVGEAGWYSCRFGPIWQGEQFDQIVVFVTNIDPRKQMEVVLQRRSEQWISLNQITRTISSLRELDGLLRLILEQLQQVIPLDCFYVGLYDPDKDRVSFPLMFDDGRFWEEEPTKIERDSLIGRCVYQEQPFLLNRSQQEIDTHECRDMLGEKTRVSASILMYPLHIEGRCIGLVSAQSYTREAYTSEQLDFLGSAAAHIAIAIHNARLFKELQSRLEEGERSADALRLSERRLRQYADRIEILHEIDQAILAIRSPHDIAAETLRRLPRIVPCTSASLALLDVEANTAEVVAIYSGGEVQVGSGEITPFQDPERLNQLLAGHIVYITDLVTQPLDGPPSLNRVLLQGPIHAVIAVPLRHQDKLVGVLSVGAAQRGQLSREDVQIAQEVATQLAISIYQTQLNTAIQMLNTELEQRVLDRTAKLESAYQELEAFSYSVSHDLRAPLRSINGYINFFIEDFGSVLATGALEYVQRIQQSARRMNTLIDDLLSLSRVGRQELKLTTFSLDEVAHLVLEEALDRRDRERIQVTFHPLPQVHADSGLMQQVMQNLIDNALKYSSNQPVSQIEIGGLEKDKKPVIYIRDNGVGFDMEFAGKLFTPFERLHSRDEYEGTGIGLATVKRILALHDGQIWFEASPGNGATFYFTIGT